MFSHGIKGSDLKTFRAIGDDLGISHGRVQQIYQRALGKMWLYIERQAKKHGCSMIEWMRGDY